MLDYTDKRVTGSSITESRTVLGMVLQRGPCPSLNVWFSKYWSALPLKLTLFVGPPERAIILTSNFAVKGVTWAASCDRRIICYAEWSEFFHLGYGCSRILHLLLVIYRSVKHMSNWQRMSSKFLNAKNVQKFGCKNSWSLVVRHACLTPLRLGARRKIYELCHSKWLLYFDSAHLTFVQIRVS